MTDCIFCQIIKGEIPCTKIYEDENFLAILDINQEAPGHTLLIPKIHYSTVYDVPEFGQYFEKARDVANVLKEKYQAETIILKVVGTDVPHAHIHLIPYGSRTQ